MCERTLRVPAAKSLSQPVGIKRNHRCSKQLPMYTNFVRCLQASRSPYSLALILPRHTKSELVPNVGPQQLLVVNPCRGVSQRTVANFSKLASPSLVPRRADCYTRPLTPVASHQHRALHGENLGTRLSQPLPPRITVAGL